MHCTNVEVSQSEANAKVIQKSTQNLKIMWSNVQFLQPGQQVSQDHEKIFTLINITLYTNITI